MDVKTRIQSIRLMNKLKKNQEFQRFIEINVKRRPQGSNKK